jgi:hypothetical protein
MQTFGGGDANQKKMGSAAIISWEKAERKKRA